MKIFCFPYAGGVSSIIYAKWKLRLKNSFEIIPVNMPGRDYQIKEDQFDSIDEVVNLLLKDLKKELTEPYAFWGHSMGAIIAYELSRKLQEEELNLPDHIFLTGKKPLHIESKSEAIHYADDEVFIKKIYEMNGTRPEVFEHPELRELFLPMLRKDFKLVHEYHHDSSRSKLQVPLTAIMGSKEKITDLEKIRWHELTSEKATIYTLEGDHFFLDQNEDEIEEIIRKTLA